MVKPVSGLTSPQISTSPPISQGADLIHPAIMEAVTRALASSEEWAKKGNEDRHQKDFKTAIEKLTLAIEIDPNNAFALARRGDCFFQQGSLDQAIVDLTSAFKLKHDPVFVLARRGDCYRRKGMVHEAIADLNTVLMRKSRHVFALASRGECYRTIGLWEKALVDLTVAIAIMPENAFALARRGSCYLQKGDPARAMLDFKEADRLNPSSLFTLQKMAECFKKMEKFNKSIVYAGRALKIMRRSASADNLPIVGVLYLRAECHKENKHFDKALKDFSEIIDLFPSSMAYKSRAYCYHIKFLEEHGSEDLLDKAIEDFDSALSFDDDTDFVSEIYSEMGSVILLKGEADKAIKYFTQAITHKKDANYYAQRGYVYMLKGDNSAAMEDVKRALGIDPHHPRALNLKNDLEIHRFS